MTTQPVPERVPERARPACEVDVDQHRAPEGRMPDTPSGAVDTPRLTVAAVARRLGVAPATLRTWDRRYGLGPSAHTPGAHRRYGAADIARLELMQRALLQGATPAEAARHALAARPPEPGAGRPVGVPRRGAGEPGAGEGGPVLLAGHPSDDELDLGARVRVGGRVLRLPGAGPRARGIGRAALSMDAPAVRRLLDEAIDADGPARAWNDVVRPVLCAVAARWESTGAGVEIEHLVSEAVTAVYGARSLAAPPSAADARPVLLASAPGEWHHLPLAVLAAVLAERGVAYRPLGPNLPLDALAAAVRRTAPAAVVLWAQGPGTADPGLFAALPRTRPRFRSFAAGPGWTDLALAPRIGRLDSLTSATDALTDLAAITHKN
ncbi:cobalamin B12-binding domain-containing protein [Pseudonocardia kujensis]|uniref:MerR family transcriptional regulator n=1 Tax=Pseudonocardia kujensis TaxID=1128675 RepID=UPI001E3A7B3A|nr:MerR family transcriptional regulator [Pseudonocardia kujensis]MCE0767841.1 cobalamin B12-binding domain-containing protein [Pseudonocardia kujensis]